MYNHDINFTFKVRSIFPETIILRCKDCRISRTIYRKIKQGYVKIPILINVKSAQSLINIQPKGYKVEECFKKEFFEMFTEKGVFMELITKVALGRHIKLNL